MVFLVELWLLLVVCELVLVVLFAVVFMVTYLLLGVALLMMVNSVVIGIRYWWWVGLVGFIAVFVIYVALVLIVCELQVGLVLSVYLVLWWCLVLDLVVFCGLVA